MFEKNGFFLDVDRNAMPMQRVMVKAMPFSKSTQVYIYLDTKLVVMDEEDSN